LGTLGLVKIIEITHVLLLKDNIRSGKIVEETFGFKPNIYFNIGNGAALSVEYTYRF